MTAVATAATSMAKVTGKSLFAIRTSTTCPEKNTSAAVAAPVAPVSLHDPRTTKFLCR
jgi:hypothetical protein